MTSASSNSSFSVIPKLDPQFFKSRFYPRFHVQSASRCTTSVRQSFQFLSVGPIIEPEEFKARYIAFFNGNAEALGIPGQMIAMLLVVWAASYGVDEYGREEQHDGAVGIRRRKQRTNDMVRELLHLIDVHGLPRKPSWDGVRVLLLVMPLTEGRLRHLFRRSRSLNPNNLSEVAEPLERLVSKEL